MKNLRSNPESMRDAMRLIDRLIEDEKPISLDDSPGAAIVRDLLKTEGVWTDPVTGNEIDFGGLIVFWTMDASMAWVYNPSN